MRILMPLLFLTFLLVPVLEIYLLIEIGSLIGAVWTVIAVVGTAALGAGLVRLQGLAALARFRGKGHSISAELTNALPGLARAEKRGRALRLSGETDRAVSRTRFANQLIRSPNRLSSARAAPVLRCR